MASLDFMEYTDKSNVTAVTSIVDIESVQGATVRGPAEVPQVESKIMTAEHSRAKRVRRPEIKHGPQTIRSKSEKARQGGSRSWLLLTYKVPAEPAKRRIALWRKLKALGAIYLQNGVCLLPKIDAHERRLKVLQNEIAEMDGDAVLLETVGLDHAQEQKVIARFSAERDEAYREFISRCDDFDGEIAKERGNGKFTYAEVEENEEDLTKLRAWLEKIIRLDFYNASLRSEAEERLARCATLLDDYAREVFEAQDENRSSSSSTNSA